MRRGRPSRRHWLLGIGGLAAAVAIGVFLGGGGDETPAPPAVLNRIADKNQDAAAEAAAHMKAQSEAATLEADQRANLIEPAAAAAAAPPAQTRR